MGKNQKSERIIVSWKTIFSFNFDNQKSAKIGFFFINLIEDCSINHIIEQDVSIIHIN